MGVGKSSLHGLEENVLRDYEELTYLNRVEILGLLGDFCKGESANVEFDYRQRVNFDAIMDKFPQIATNPFKDRIYTVFSSLQDCCFGFEDLLDLFSVMSERCPAKVKAAWAFRIFDFDEDGGVGEEDIVKVIDRITQGYNVLDPNQQISMHQKMEIAKLLDAAELRRLQATDMSKLLNAKRARRVQERQMLRGLGYSLGRTIGQGTYSKVCLATTNTGDQSEEKVACKIIHKKLAGEEFIRKFLPRELGILRHIQHRNIVTVYNIIEIQDVIFIVMDYCRNGDLLEFIKQEGPLREDRAKLFFKQMVSAVDYLHDLDVAHRDLKCENILLTGNNVIKIGDFGFARSCINKAGQDILSDTYCGSAAYAAPEIIQGIPYDPKMYDIWALGCILYIMISATMPFDDTNIKKMLKNQLNRSLCVSAFKSWKKYCIHLRNLIAYLLEPDVDRRATISQVANCIWLQDTGDANLLYQVSETSLF